MASPIVANVIPPVEYTALTDASGVHNVLMPSVCVQQLRALGLNRITITLMLNPGDVPRPTMTVMEAAERHCKQFHWLTIQAAKMKILRACKAGKLPSSVTGRSRRIDPDGFAKWHASELIRDTSRG